ncbi:acyltransferase [Rhodococcus sp. 077-4]|uniref:acyltransferase n=1 Tax=Rhodococcus sp. 077-4 TaxID=2789271 RepID=UPI0039F5F83A
MTAGSGLRDWVHSSSDVVWALVQMRQATTVSLANLPFWPAVLRASILRPAGLRTDGPCLVYGGSMIQGRESLRLGTGVFVNFGCYFDTVADIVIGDHVFVADHVRILTSTHDTGPSGQRAGALQGQPVTIGRGAWIGSGVVVMPGVHIGAGCIIGANSVVTRDCEPDGVYVGSPARRRRDLSSRPAEQQ